MINMGYLSKSPDKKGKRKSSQNVRNMLVSGVFWRIMVIEMILLVWSLGYRAATEEASAVDLFWFAVRILILVGIIIAFVTISLSLFLKKKIILPLEKISAANLNLNTESPSVNAVDLPPDTPKEIAEIVDTRRRMLEAILDVSNQRLGLVKFIRETFGRYLSKKVVDEILSSPEGSKIGKGRRETVTILMADLRGFTSRAENSDPEETLHLLNRFFGSMAQIITTYDGMIDEFLGDGILTIFGVPEAHPDDPARAVACALEMQNALQKLNEELKTEGIRPLEMGIGINTGSVIVGNIGSKIRAKYGIVGIPVNTASRIESLTVGGQVLIGEPTYRLIASSVEVSSAQTAMMKGYKEPLVCFPVKAIHHPHRIELFIKTPKGKAVEIQLPMTIWVIDGKEIKEPSIQGRTLSVNQNLWKVEIESILPSMTDLKLQINFCSEAHCFKPVYAKVVNDKNKYSPHILNLTITAIDQEDQDIIEWWIGKSKPSIPEPSF